MAPPTGVSMSSALTPGGAGGAAARPGPPAPVAATAAAAASSPLVPGGAAGSSVSCGCRPPPRSPRGGVSGGGCFKSNIGGRGGGGGGVSGGGRPASSRGLRASDSIDSLDSGHTSDDSSRSVDSVTSVDVLALGTAKGGLADKVAAAVAGVPVSFPPVGTRPDAPVVAAPVAAEAAAAVTTTTTTVAALPPTASLVAARAALPLRRLNHISFTVQDPEATAAFFEAVLGYTRIVRPRSFDPAGIWLGWGVPPADQWAGQGRYGVALSGLQVHLIAGRPLSRPADVQSDRDHLSFEADDVEAVAACLRDRGISYIDEVFPHEGLRQLFFHEPSSRIMIEVCNCQHFAVVPLATPPAHGGSEEQASPPLSTAATNARPSDTTAAHVTSAAATAATAAAAVTAVAVGASALPIGTPPRDAAL